jgi:phosphoglycerol transferase
MHTLWTLIITFALAAIPYSFYYALTFRQKKRMTAHIIQYIEIAVFFSLLYLFIFSLYKFKLPVSALEILWIFNIKFVVVSCLISSAALFIYARVRKKNITLICEFNRIPKYVIITLWIFLLLICVSLEFTQVHDVVPIEQLIFHLALPKTGANFSMVKYFFIRPFINALFILIFFLYVLSAKIYVNGYAVFIPFSKLKKPLKYIVVILLATGIMYTVAVTGLPQYLTGTLKEPSTFYEEHYIFPNDAAITFPEKKRNLIVIIIESLETGFLTVENGGAFAEDLIPEITELAKKHINFSGNNGIGGAVQLYGTEWTIAGIAAYYSGVPLAVPFINRSDGGNYGQLGDAFLPGAYSIGDILHDAGYSSYFFLGSDIAFGGRDKYFKTHKDTIIFDYNYFRDNNFIPEDYRVWWGIEDRKLYRFAKNMILDIAQEEPFFITLLTVDTHPLGGYLDEEAEVVFDSQYKNVLRDASKQLSGFVEWIQKQDFYENTTVVILGDHLYQDSSIFPEKFKIKASASKHEKDYFSKNGGSAYNRYPLNIFINSPLNPNSAKGRIFSHFDLFPVLIESIGGVYTGEGLGLGRSLHERGGGGMIEKYGVVAINEQLWHKSALYNTLWGARR